jgi:hypothetical protein
MNDSRLVALLDIDNTPIWFQKLLDAYLIIRILACSLIARYSIKKNQMPILFIYPGQGRVFVGLLPLGLEVDFCSLQ